MELTFREIWQNTSEYADKEIILEGWVRSNRDAKKFGFLQLNDGTFLKPIQVVYDDSLSNFNEITKLSIETAVRVRGKLILTPDSKQPFEVKCEELSVLATSEKDYPLQKKRHTMEFLREIAYLRPKSNTFSSVFRVRSIISQSIHEFFGNRNFVYVHTPIITASDCEGAGEVFQVTTLDMNDVPRNDRGEVDYSQDFFAKETGLTVSGQLEGEAFALALRNIYTFGPTFRAENSNTTRHASEFWMVEPEIAFADLEDDMKLAEDMIKYIISSVLKKAPEEMNFFNSFIDKGLIERLENILNSDFEKITYTKAIEILENSSEKFQYPVSWGVDLQTEHERYITEKVFKKPVFVTDYPKDIKAFYMRLNDDGKTVAACDLLVPGVGEIIGGSQREERLDILESRMKEMNLDSSDYQWYLNLRKYGGVRHAGFGLGLERIVMYITGITNIRDVIAFPRTPKNAEF